jgi:hypothetical protein
MIEYDLVTMTQPRKSTSFLNGVPELLILRLVAEREMYGYVVGNGLINGFIWYENMQLTFVPEPVGCGLSVVGGFLAFRRRRCG